MQIFINFVSDVSSGVAEVKLDASALINGGAAGNKTYVDVINRLTAAGALVVSSCILTMFFCLSQNDLAEFAHSSFSSYSCLCLSVSHTHSLILSLIAQLCAGIGVHLTVSLAMQNDTPNDVKGFHAAFEALASQMPSTVLGVTYDIEEPKVQ